MTEDFDPAGRTHLLYTLTIHHLQGACGKGGALGRSAPLQPSRARVVYGDAGASTSRRRRRQRADRRPRLVFGAPGQAV